jgi:hypothetical protein
MGRAFAMTVAGAREEPVLSHGLARTTGVVGGRQHLVLAGDGAVGGVALGFLWAAPVPLEKFLESQLARAAAGLRTVVRLIG